jgi:hypothetical protein
MATKSHGRAAAWTAAVILALIAGFQFYWGLGGTWELHEASGAAAPPVSASDQFSIVLIGVVALWFAVVLFVRVGYLPKLAQFAVARINAWVIAAVALGGAIQDFAAQTDFERFVSGPLNLIVALLAFVVARSELPGSLRSGAAPTPSGKPGRPNPTH